MFLMGTLCCLVGAVVALVDITKGFQCSHFFWTGFGLSIVGVILTIASHP